MYSNIKSLQILLLVQNVTEFYVKMQCKFIGFQPFVHGSEDIIFRKFW
jgi:hypothetical protein